MFGKSNTRLNDQDSFYQAFINDISHARNRIIIESPFMTTKRVKHLLPILARLIKRGVKVVINTKPFDEHEGLLYEMTVESVEQLQSVGVQVIMTVGHHRKLAVVDEEILWEGSLNILSQNDSCEFMRRINSRHITRETVSYLHLDIYYAIK